MSAVCHVDGHRGVGLGSGYVVVCVVYVVGQSNVVFRKKGPIRVGMLGGWGPGLFCTVRPWRRPSNNP